MASRPFLLLSGQGIFWSGLRIGLLTVLALSTRYFFGQYLPNRAQQPLRNESALAGVDDWSHHHLVFSQSSDLPSELRIRLQKEPRFANQRRMRVGMAMARLVASTRRPAGSASGRGSGSGKSSGMAAPEFWSENLGTDATVGPGNFPARFSFNVANANCANDLMVVNTRRMGTAGQASVVALNHLYAGCAGMVPSVYWAYNTGGQILTSVVLSPLGDQVAFVHSASGGASLIVLKWSLSTGEVVDSPVTLISSATTGIVSNSAYRSCDAPCMTGLAFGGNANDTISSPFYDYADDAIYVGDDAGVLHKFDHIFNGDAPAESGSHFPVVVDRGKILTSPVLDVLTGNVFVGDSGGYLSYVETTGSTPGAVVRGRNLGAGIADAPIVDSTAARAYVFVTHDSTPSGAGSAVYQFTTTFSPGNAGAEQTLNRFSGGNAHYRGAFDEPYLTSAGASPTGSLYLCGPDSGSESKLVLYRLPVVNNVLGAGSAVAAAGASAFPPCYPDAGILKNPSLVSNGKTSDAFGIPAAAIGRGSLAGPSAGLTSPAGRGSAAGNPVPSETVPGASGVHFVTLDSQLCAASNRTSGCAVQAAPDASQ